MARIKPQALLVQSKRKKGPSRISLPTIMMYCLVIGLVVLSFVAYRQWSPRSQVVAQSHAVKLELQEMDTITTSDTKKYDLPSYAMLDTSKGQITVELFKDGVPEIVDKFLDVWWIS